ncbi:MAG: penicillin-binding protein 2 [Omnitrophica bacterium]|nr:penicillin-binding protein 2 [Candidatus Omnitrophota bacterium]
MRIKLLRTITLGCFVFLIMGLAFNQIIKGPYYFSLSQNNRIKLIRLSAPRGLIYDSRGRILAGARASFNVAVLAQEVKDVQKTLDAISPVLEISPEGLQKQFRRNFSTPFVATVVAKDIPKQTAIVLECREAEIPGLVIQAEPVRDYRYGAGLGHILGYLGWMRKEEVEKFKMYGLRVKDLVGRSGIEEEFDYYLRGHPGGMQAEVNNRGYLVRVLGERAAQSGQDIYLTVNAELQKFIDSLLEEKKGVCIVMNPQNGEIKALVSKPTFDPNLFIAALSEDSTAASEIRELLKSKEAPLVNRAISGTYSPGSIFKIVVAAAGLESTGLSPEDRQFCSGVFRIGNRDFFCWKLNGHGSKNISSAIAYSCNVFFYKLGLALGADRLSSFARKFGLGLRTGIDLPYESAGFVPSKKWKLKSKKERWYDGETANFSIGQGYLLTTPLQIARIIAAIANGGYLVQPRIVKKVGAHSSSVLRKKIGLKKETLEIIKEGMRQAVQQDQGTGQRARIAGIEWAAKTGTAQSPSGPAHGWFAGFYPLEQAHTLVLVFLEYGGSGGETPALIAKEIVEYIIRELDVGGRT